MDAEKWKDTILAKSREYVELGVSVANDLTEKGKTQAKILSNQAKISKAQRQLGALVYSLAKGNEENQPLVDRYIDNCLMSGLDQVSIIHGKGTGALRAGIQDYLKRDKRVKSYRMGAYGEGDAGVTVVTLKK